MDQCVSMCVGTFLCMHVCLNACVTPEVSIHTFSSSGLVLTLYISVFYQIFLSELTAFLSAVQKHEHMKNLDVNL